MTNFDESKAIQTVQFGQRGQQYAIDLNDEHAEEFDSLLSRYVAGRPGHDPAGSSAITDPAEATESAQKCAEKTARIRKWARDHDMKVSDHGRIPLNMLGQYDLAKSRGQVS